MTFPGHKLVRSKAESEKPICDFRARGLESLPGLCRGHPSPQSGSLGVALGQAYSLLTIVLKSGVRNSPLCPGNGSQGLSLGGVLVFLFSFAF